VRPCVRARTSIASLSVDDGRLSVS
jgi:hypothetical protein